MPSDEAGREHRARGRAGPSARPAGNAASAPAVRKIAGPSPRMPSIAGDEHERDGARRRRASCTIPESDGQRRREQDRVAADGEALHRSSLCQRSHEPVTERRRAAVDGMADVRRRRGARCATPADGDGTRRPRASASRNGRRRSISARVGAAVRRRRAGMRRHDVPEQHVVVEPELGEHAVDDRRRRLGRPAARELALGGERDAARRARRGSPAPRRRAGSARRARASR